MDDGALPDATAAHFTPPICITLWTWGLPSGKAAAAKANELFAEGRSIKHGILKARHYYQ